MNGLNPEDFTKGAVLGIKDFFVLLGGAIIGQLVAAVDSLSIGNALVGIPVGLFAGTKYVKSGLMKELLMGFGLGMTLQGTADVFGPTVADAVDKAFKTVGITSVRDTVTTGLKRMTSGLQGLFGGISLTGAGAGAGATTTTTTVANYTLTSAGGYAF